VRILIVKLTSLGDVIHAMPALQDIRCAFPGADVDWVVERSFAPLVERCEGVERVLGTELRRWRKAPLSAVTRAEWRAFRRELRSRPYDAVLDLQGLTKSALVARAAKVKPDGQRFALANRTEGSSWEPPTRWVADVALRMDTRVHAVMRSRELCARALGYDLPKAIRYGLSARPVPGGATGPAVVALVHGTSRDDKCWPESHWVELGHRLVREGYALALPHGSDEERERSERLAHACGPAAQVWPRMGLDALCDRLAACAGVIGVDSGLSHLAVALDRPHVQIYNFDTAWRTGPLGSERQQAVFAQPHPSPAAVWAAWQVVRSAP
jgi:heptosyltransferase-1